MTDREKKLAEIRVKAEFLDGCESKIEVNLPDLSKDIRFLLSELERKDEVVREVYEGNTNMRDALQDAASEVKKLREEREKWEKEARLQYRLFNEYQDESREKIEQLRAERDKLIEGLRWYADEKNHELDESTRHWENVYSPYEMDGGQRAREILKEIGVTVE
ncbi:hypothetical protein PACILC2_07030 [Paenibacillus cisolokensis]|uniref:Ead/Ea22-like family protein n=2 Tax=Paenibacillus cisolokensis TaxID=1658519 RepID=A0ABQ4N1T2_9BACL|nr:hypothetical protein PACILC2_07030 [Paenibacillus cisolokensis]